MESSGKTYRRSNGGGVAATHFQTPGAEDCRRSGRGFTLIELMVVVAIVGILSAVAIPSFVKYTYKARTSEALTHIEKIYNGARTYYLDRPGLRTVASIAMTFPDTIGVTPAASCCSANGDNKCQPRTSYWESPTWTALSFAVVDPHFYRFAFISTGMGIGASFTAQAFGDLDCDGTESTFEMAGVVMSNGSDMTGNAAIYRENDIE